MSDDLFAGVPDPDEDALRAAGYAEVPQRGGESLWRDPAGGVWTRKEALRKLDAEDDRG